MTTRPTMDDVCKTNNAGMHYVWCERQNVVSEAYCSVCDEKSVLLKICFCNLCQWSFSLCVKCEVLSPDYRQPEPDYCPQCNDVPIGPIM